MNGPDVPAMTGIGGSENGLRHRAAEYDAWKQAEQDLIKVARAALDAL
jgi:hypothetical protein